MKNFLENYLLNSATASKWDKIGIFPHHGIVIPLSGLHSKDSLGIGEFLDLIPLIDWVAFLGMDVIQLLPLNDSATDPSPYNAISSCALNPVYIRLSELDGLIDDSRFQNKLHALQKCNKEELVPYQKVYSLKMEILEQYFLLYFAEFHKKESYQAFLFKNPWLMEYGLYKALRNETPLEYWSTWPSYLSNPSEQVLFHLVKKYNEDIQFYSFLQYLCFQQMGKVKEYATSKGILLKGDMSYMVSPDSSDVWFNKDLFETELVAGAPPDMYNSKGQKWGFPLFNWEEQKKTHYFWWKRRLNVAENFFHLYRMDHVVGFFRIWGIPKLKEAVHGNFVPYNRYIWPLEGKEHLKMLLELSGLLPIAEDLGTIPPEVGTTLKELGIPGTKVMYWNRYWEEDGSFVKPENYEPISLTTVTTHDSETMDFWWETNPLEAKEYARSRGWRYQKKFTSDLRFEFLKDSHQTPSLFHINLLGEYLAFFPELVHDSPILDRINLPGIWRKENWTYRFIPSVEEIISHNELTTIMKSLITGEEKKITKVLDNSFKKKIYA